MQKLIDDRSAASPMSDQGPSYPDMAPPIFFKGVGIIMGLCVSAGAGTLAFTALIVFFRIVGDPVPLILTQFSGGSQVFLYSVWIIGTCAGQGFAAVVGRWTGAVWVIAAFNAISFLLIYFAFGKPLILIIPVFIPFVSAYFIRRSPLILNKIAVGKIWRMDN